MGSPAILLAALGILEVPHLHMHLEGHIHESHRDLEGHIHWQIHCIHRIGSQVQHLNILR